MPALWRDGSVRSFHVATAVKMKVPVLDTFDEEMIELSGQIGNPSLRITTPDIPFQDDLFREDDEKTKKQTKRKSKPKK